MNLDYSTFSKVKITMINYIQGILVDAPEEFMEATPNPAASHLFDTEVPYLPLDINNAKLYYHHCMQLLYLSNRTSAD